MSIRVAQVTASMSRRAGGLFYSVSGLTRALLSIDAVEIATFSLEDLSSEEDAPKWEGIPLHLHASLGPRQFGYSRTMLSDLVAWQPDVVHAHGIWMYPTVASTRWGRRTGRPYLISPRGMLDSWALEQSAARKKLALQLFEKRNLLGASCIHALSESEAASIRNLGFRAPICLLPNGVDLPGETTTEPKWKEGIPQADKVLLYLGRLHPKKQLPNLLKAWRELASRNVLAQDWWLVIAGWDQLDHREALEAYTRAHNLPRVVFTGPVFGRQKEAFLAGADGFILPSISEGLPMAILEAWSYRLPVLMSKECNLPEGFSARAAFKISPNVEDIATGLRELFQMPLDRLVEMGENGRKLVETSYSWPTIARQMHEVYLWLLDRGDRPDCVLLD